MTSTQTVMMVLALDPGREKSGVAVVENRAGETQVLWRGIVATAEIERVLSELLSRFPASCCVLGHATSSRAMEQRLKAWRPDWKIEIVDERDSTLQARRLFWQANPPRGWRKLLPLSLQMPPEPVDDFAAVVLAQRFFAG